jgi:tetratricopeptide (TPR) repeat protein
MTLSPWPRGRSLLAAAAIAIAALAAYANSFRVPLLLDDVRAISQNATIRDLSDFGAVLSPPASSGPSGRPLLNLSFALNYAVGGEGVFGYHLVNLALHILAALVLFGVVNRVLLQWQYSAATDRTIPGSAAGARSAALHPTWLALGIALIWTVHPLQTEAVTYISERAETLMALFYLLTLYGFCRYAGEAPGRPIWAWLSVAACLLGVTAKEVMATAPVLVFLCDAIFFAGSLRAAWRLRPRYYAGLAASWGLLAWIMLTRSKHSVGFGQGVGVWEYALTECQAVVHYLELALWPHPLVFDYGPLLATGLGKVLPEAIALVILLLAAAAALWRAPAWGFLGAWFFVILAPTSSFVPVALQPIAESRMYLPLAAVVTAFVLAAHRLLGPRVRWVVLAVALAALAGTVRRNQDYRDELSIWSDTAMKRPHSPRAQTDYADALAHAGRLDEAIDHFRLALQLTPGISQIHFNLAQALRERGRLAESIPEYQAALRLQPSYADAQINLAAVLAKMGRREEAQALLGRAVALEADDAQTHYRLGGVLFAGDRVVEARQQFERALQLKPDFGPAHTSLGLAELQLGHMEAAKGQFEAALQFGPSDAEAHFRLGNIFAMGGHIPEAMAQWQEALRLRPDDAEAHNNLAMALSQTGRIPEAIQHYEEALRIQPNYERARENLADLRAQAK